jgi:hypothetical protein
MRSKVGAVAALVLLALLAILLAKPKFFTAEQAEGDVVREAGTLKDVLLGDNGAAIAVVVLIALFAFVLWTAIRANARDSKSVPPSGEAERERQDGVPKAG